MIMSIIRWCFITFTTILGSTVGVIGLGIGLSVAGSFLLQSVAPVLLIALGCVLFVFLGPVVIVLAILGIAGWLTGQVWLWVIAAIIALIWFIKRR